MNRAETKSFSRQTTVAFVECCYLFAGLTFVDDGEVLRATPKERITDYVREEIKRRKPVILRMLKGEAVKGEPCKVCGWEGDTWDGWCEFCIDPAMEAEAQGCELILCSM